MAPIKKLPGCGRKAWIEGICGNYQALSFKKGDKEHRLFFRSSDEREAYYKENIQGKEGYSHFGRGSVCSTKKPTKDQRTCKKPKPRNNRRTRKSKRRL
jgi:hypothetical protein